MLMTKRILAAGLLILFLLCGCAKETKRVEVPHVRLSNTKTSASPMSGEEKTRFDTASELIRNAQVQIVGDSIQLSVTNSTQYDWDILPYVILKDASGTIVQDRNHLYPLTLFAGESAEVHINYFTKVTGSILVGAEYSWNGSYYRTDPVPIAPTQEESDITVLSTDPLPHAYTFSDTWKADWSFTLADIQVVQQGYSEYVVVRLHKDRGPRNQGDRVCYRFLTQDGAVVMTGSQELYFSPGEDHLLSISTYGLLPGTYVLELLSEF